jgi:hypothetical protein
LQVLVSGSSGLIGSTLCRRLAQDGTRVLRLVRREARHADERSWDPDRGELAPAALDGVDALVHLGGESVAGGRWTSERKQRIRDSRLKSTALLADAFRRAAHPPRVFVCASAIGYYGNAARETFTEASPAGAGFLPELCVEWERAAEPARDAGARLVHARIGIVLSRNGGALASLLPIFRLGLGGPVGNGRQWMSWINLHDVVEALGFALLRDELQGPVNLTAPSPATNAEFTRALARVLKRPAFFPVPAVMIRLLYGEMGARLIVEGNRVLPQRLLEAGFRFEHGTLDGAIRAALAESAA